MEKNQIGTVFLILTLGLAGVGASLAGLTDTLNIQGSISTGSVTYEIMSFSGTDVYKVWSDNPNVAVPPNELLISHWPDDIHNPETEYPGANYERVAWSEAHHGADDDVEFTFNNMFPCVNMHVDFTFKYIGAVPARIDEIGWNIDQQNEPWMQYIDIEATMRHDDNEVIEGYQLHTNDEVKVELWIHLQQQNVLQNKQITGNAWIKLIQWDEYTPPDNDGDGIPDEQDNCPDTYNPSQEDMDNDGIGDACDDCIPDCEGKECGDDGCGGLCAECPTGYSCINYVCVPNGDTCSNPIVIDNVPYSHNSDTTDMNHEYYPTCTSQHDSKDIVYSLTSPSASETYIVTTITAEKYFDPVLYAAKDCSDISGSTLACSDNSGDASEESISITIGTGETAYIIVDGYQVDDFGPYTLTVEYDTDSDGIPNSEDNCPDTSNPGQEDNDGDGIGDICDNCPDTSNPGQEDNDGDGIGDICEIGTYASPGLSAAHILSVNPSSPDGIYWIDPDGEGGDDPFQAYCDMTTDSGGWTLVLLSNINPASCPQPDWDEVVNDINYNGVLSADLTSFDLFMGVKNWNILGDEIRLDMGENPTSLSHRAYYDFNLDTANNYALQFSNEVIDIHTEGTASPGMYTYHNNRQLTTKDADHDSHSHTNCAHFYDDAAWWYGACWSGSFWGGGTESYQDAPYWTGSHSEHFDYASIWVR